MRQEIENYHRNQLVHLKKAIYLRYKFSLMVAVFNHYPYRDKLIRDINKTFKDSVVLEITTESFPNFETFEERIASLSKTYSLIHVVNQGERLYKDTIPLFYKGLNYHREAIADENPVPIILWMLPEDVRDFVRDARDMWSWHGGVFDFEVKEEEYEKASLSPFKRLAPEEKTKKQKRIDDIINFLDHTPDLEDNLKATLQKELAQLYYALSNYIKAEEYARESLDLYEKRGDVEEMYHLYNILEAIYRDMDKDEKALQAAAVRIFLKMSSDVDKYSLKKGEDDMKEKKEAPDKVLVVDDEPDMKRLIEQKFRKQIRSKEWEFVYANNGLEALERMQLHPDISVILLDIRMPDMDGLAFLDRLNAMDKPTIKTIMATAFGDMENIRESMNKGAFDFVIKKIDFNDLEKTIRKAFKQINIIKEALRAQKELTAFQKELEIAFRIQNAMLPREFPPCLHAQMKAAKEVGGDFYDYVSIDKNRIAFFIGDVAGKGLSAALYATKCSTILKSLAEQVKHPDECLRILNERIIEEKDEDSNLSVSLFYGLLDLRSGDIEYSSAGNVTCPYIINKNGELKQVKEMKGMPSGFFGNTDYDLGRDKLTKGDMVCIFTDGVTDAQNIRSESYGDDKNRIISVLKKAAEMSAEDMVNIFMKDVRTFINDAPQTDDITILALKIS